LWQRAGVERFAGFRTDEGWQKTAVSTWPQANFAILQKASQKRRFGLGFVQKKKLKIYLTLAAGFR
jgi:hypothetical protein